MELVFKGRDLGEISENRECAAEDGGVASFVPSRTVRCAEDRYKLFFGAIPGAVIRRDVALDVEGTPVGYCWVVKREPTLEVVRIAA